MAAMYRKETYPDDNDLSNIEDAELVKHWVDLAVEYADDADEFLNIIEAVSEPHQGLYLGDKSWGKELLEQIVSKTDSDVSKKVAASGKKLLD